MTVPSGAEQINDRRLRAALIALREVLRPALIKSQGVRSCLQTAAVVHRVLRDLGYQARVLPVVVQFYNDVIYNQMQNGEAIDIHAPGAFARQIGTGEPTEDGWEGAGHVIVLCPLPRGPGMKPKWVLVDLALDQMDYDPDGKPRGMGVSPSFGLIADAQVTDLLDGTPITLSATGSTGRPYLVTYVGMLADTSYQTAQTFTDPQWRRVAEEVAKAIRMQFAANAVRQ